MQNNNLSVTKDKRGSFLFDLFLFMIVFFVLIVTIGILNYSFKAVTTQLYAVAPSIPAPGLNTTNIFKETVGVAMASYNVLNWISVMIIVAMFLNILITSAYIKTYPPIFVAYCFITLIAVIFSAYIAHIYNDISTGTIASGFSILSMPSYILSYFPIWITVIGFIAGILLFINIDWGMSY